MVTELLLVDDDAALRRAAQRAFPARVVAVATLGEAREALRHTAFDVVLVDLGADGEGLAVLRAARDQQPQALRWLTTGHAARPAAHADLWHRLVTKPWTSEILADVASAAEDARTPQLHLTVGRRGC